MRITRRFTQPGRDVFATVEWEKRTSRITDADGKVVFEMLEAEVPEPYLNSLASRTHTSMIPPSPTRSSLIDWMKHACG